MSDQPERLWFQDSLNQIAIARARAEIAGTGKAIPCHVVAVSGSLVTVSFDVDLPQTLPQITIPKAEGQWIRSPTQVGDFGLALPSDYYLGGVSGLGGGAAGPGRRGNLSTLVWVPIARTSFSPVNVNAAFVSGEAGAVIQDAGGSNVVTLDNAGNVTITSKTKIVLNAPEIQLNGLVSQGSYGGSAGTVTLIGPVTVVNDVKANGISLDSHVHGGVQSGGSDTTGPIG